MLRLACKFYTGSKCFLTLTVPAQDTGVMSVSLQYLDSNLELDFTHHIALNPGRLNRSFQSFGGGDFGELRTIA